MSVPRWWRQCPSVGVTPAGSLEETNLRKWQADCIFRLARRMSCDVWLLDDWIATRHRRYRDFEEFVRSRVSRQSTDPVSDNIWYGLKDPETLYAVFLLSCKPGDYLFALVPSSGPESAAVLPQFDGAAVLVTTRPKASDLRFRWRAAERADETLRRLTAIVEAATAAASLTDMGDTIRIVADLAVGVA